MQTIGSYLYLKQNSDTDISLWLLQNVSEQFFYRTSIDNCFCNKSLCLQHTYYNLLIAPAILKTIDFSWSSLNGFWGNCPPDNCPMDNCPQDNCPLDNCPPDKLPPDNWRLDNCPLDNYTRVVTIQVIPPQTFVPSRLP